MSRSAKALFRILSLSLIVNCIFALKTDAYKGDVTFHYEWRGNLGSCALKQSKKDPFYAVALSRFFMKLPRNTTNSNKHPLCANQHCIKVTGKRGSVVLKVSDTCHSCKAHDVDVADKVFPLLDDPRKGRVSMTWQWVDCRRTPPGQLEP